MMPCKSTCFTFYSEEIVNSSLCSELLRFINSYVLEHEDLINAIAIDILWR